MRAAEKVKKRIYGLSLRERLTYSNILMFLIPVVLTVLTALAAVGVAFYAFVRFYLPRMGLTVRGLHEMGEQFEGELKSFVVLVAVLCVIMLALLVLAVVLTNRFLVRFMLRRVEEPLERLTAGVAKVSAGQLDYELSYDRTDEFRPVCDAFDDMTSRLRDAAERSAAEEQSRRELFAGISHDLRSPLTSVRAYTEALLDGVAKTPEDTRRYLTKIQRHEAEIERMVDALFLYTKMELRDYPVHLAPLDLRAELGRICGGALDSPDAHLAVDLSGVGDLRVEADPFLLERVVLNLLDNSRKYRRGDVAHVRISAVREERDTCPESCAHDARDARETHNAHDAHETHNAHKTNEVRDTCPENGILLSVADDGVGVPEEQLGRLFDPFYRTDPARRNPAGGSGLGLSVVREAVGHLGGRVWAENVPGGGLDVKIILVEANDAEHTDN